MIIFIPVPSEEPLAGCAAERHDEVLDWRWKYGWPDSTNPYIKGDKVMHNNKVWESQVDNNTWEPDVIGTETLWIEVAE